MSDWRQEGIPDKIPKQDGRFLDLGFWASGNYLERQLNPTDLLDIIIAYYGYKIKEFEDECSKIPYNKWDGRHELCSTSLAVYMQLLKFLTSQDYDYLEDMADDIGYFYDQLIQGYLYTKQKGQEGERAGRVFLIGIRMMQDLMDHIYYSIGLPID